MILQYSTSDIDWVIGLGIMFGFALLYTIILKGDMSTFFYWTYIMNGVVVWAGLLEPWTIILNTIFIIVLLAFNIKNRGIS